MEESDNDMNFSVLLSVYKKEMPDYFNQAFVSIWDEQTLKPNQIVLVKDGPLTPELDQAIDEWKKKLGDILAIVELPENIGLGAALNEGLKYCKYELVARMDSDDISMPERFEKQVAFFEKDEKVAIVGTNILEFYEGIP
jgi:glycosyltransferase involved in cell wall biosynthesis